MREHSKAIKRQLRELNWTAYEAALGQEQRKLARHFEEWRQGTLDSFALNELIHKYHHGPARKLYNRYADAGGMEELNVAAAIVDGLLRRDQVSAEVLAAIGDCIQMIEQNRAAEESAPDSRLEENL